MAIVPAPNSNVPPPVPNPVPQPVQSEQVPPEPPPAPGDMTPRLTFWQQPLVQNLLPLGTSLAVHIGIIIVALVIGGTVAQVAKMVVQEQITVPDASFTDGPVGGIPNPGLGGDPNKA